MGIVLRVLDAKGSQDTAVNVVTRAGATEEVFVAGFSFDRNDFFVALLGAKRRGCRARVLLDKSMTLTGRTRDQLSCAKELVAGGVLVRVVDGVPLTAEYAKVGRRVPGHLRGIQHSKLCMVGDQLLAGSCNWTTSSRSNWEIGVHTRIIHHEAVRELVTAGWAGATDLSIATIGEAHRARSESPSGRGGRR